MDHLVQLSQSTRSFMNKQQGSITALTTVSTATDELSPDCQPERLTFDNNKKQTRDHLGRSKITPRESVANSRMAIVIVSGGLSVVAIRSLVGHELSQLDALLV